MGIFDKLIGKSQEKSEERIERDSVKVASGKNMTADDILTNDAEVERLSKYISESEKKKILTQRSAVKHGVEKIGTKDDSNKVLRQLLAGAKKKSKDYAAKILARKYRAQNLTDKIMTKAKKEIQGQMLSKNIYLKKVSYVNKLGRTIEYLQARNLKTGRIVAYKSAMRLISRK